VSGSGRARTLDADELAGLEREREFLLRSLDDLDAEFAAGDLDERDHSSLSNDYTRRLAEVARSIDEQRSAFASIDNRLSPRQRWVTIGTFLALALVAGVLLARASGFRSPEDSTTGDIRQSSVGLLSEADVLTREGQWPEAIEIYSEVLNISPANVEALTYRGWLTARLGDTDAGLLDLGEAVAVDGEFPDARVFRAILLEDVGDHDGAAAEIDVLDELEVPDDMLGIIAASDLRASVVAGQIRERFSGGDQVSLNGIRAPLNDVARAGALLSQTGENLLAIATFDAVLAQDPAQIIALVGKGQLARDSGMFTQFPELAEESLGFLDEAVSIDPESPAIRLYRADARLVQGDAEGAKSDLDVIDPAVLSGDLRPLYEQLVESLNEQ